MNVTDKLLRGKMKVLVNKCQQSASDKQNEQPFCCFKNGYDTNAVFF